MESATQNRSSTDAANTRRIDFVSPKASKPKSSQTAAPAASAAENSAHPAAVTSAKDAFNARYAAQKTATAQDATTTAHPLTAREAVNAAVASQNAARADKSAAGLHRGKIQKNLESTRPSASALIKVASSPQPPARQVQAIDSFDPLAKVKSPAPLPQNNRKQEIPVVRTSLKLGEAARPRRPPVILPPNARMARIARPVDGDINAIHRAKKQTLLNHNPNGVQIIQPNSVNPRSRQPVIGDGFIRQPGKSQKALAANAHNLDQLNVADARNTGQSNAGDSRNSGQPNIKAAAIQHPESEFDGAQSIRVARISGAQQAAGMRAISANTPGSTPARAKRFRSAPKNFATKHPAPVGVDKSYVMTAPPKLNLAHVGTLSQDMAELGVHDEPQTGIKPTVGVAVPAQHSVTSDSELDFVDDAFDSANAARRAKSAAENKAKSNRKKSNNHYTADGESPFLKTVNVEKRPLSDTPVSPRVPLERPKIETRKTSRGKLKAPKKNVYESQDKGRKSKNPKAAPVQPVMIIPNSRRSKAPLFFLVLITIILGAAVGAAVYLCLFQ